MDLNMKKGLKIIFYILTAIVVIIIVGFFILGIMSKNGQALGLLNGQLQACPTTENCVISERINGADHTIEPFTFIGNTTSFSNKLQTVIQSLGGEVVVIDEGYIAATFRSPIFGFVDDLELRITHDQRLHFRSSSRVGKSDLGANKRRVEALKLLLKE